MEDEFLSAENVCGRELLNIVARGSAILAELQCMHLFVPKMFSSPDDKHTVGMKYKMNYKTISYITFTQELFELNESLKNTYLPLLERFFRLFESIYDYYETLKRFLREMKEGAFIQFSLENIFEINTGKQLLCEAIYLFGVMLLLTDQLIDGGIRERIFVCYYRNSEGESIPRIQDIRTLCYDTGYRIESRRTSTYVRPKNYPEDYFARFEFEQELMESVIIGIKDDDLYRQMGAYPQAKQRSFALATQASMLFVLLFFIPRVLVKANSTMREVVDKHFYNVWVITFYLGYIVDLIEWWRPYKAAKLALDNVLDPEEIQIFASDFVSKQKDCYNKCNEYLAEGIMSEEFVTDNLIELIACVREANITLRWLMLHRKTENPKLKQMLHSISNDILLLRLVLVCAEFETLLKQRIAGVLSKKEELWKEDKDGCAERLKELSEYFGKGQTLGRREADESLQEWFTEISGAVGSLNYSDSTYATRKIQAFADALTEIQEYSKVGSNIQVRSYLVDCQRDLAHMLVLVGVKPSVLSSLEVITDFTWSWTALQDYIPLMQREIRKNPNISLLLKSTFQKLSSILNTPMVRMFEAQSVDCENVSQFYSNELVRNVKIVLQSIPELVFENLGSIINIFTESMQIEPQTFDKADLLKYAQFTERLSVSKLTNEISLFAESILNMENYEVGVSEINPRQILEAGLRKELLKLIAKIQENSLKNVSKNAEEFLTKISKLSAKVANFKLSMEFIQDFIHIFGLKMFHECFNKLIEAYLDMEKAYLLTGRKTVEALHYKDDIPLPSCEYENSVTFLGGILHEILVLTAPRKCIFLFSAYGFYETETKKEAFTLKTMNVLNKCIGITGMHALDYLLSLKIAKTLKKIIKLLRNTSEDETIRKQLAEATNYLKTSFSLSEKYESVLTLLKRTLKNYNENLTPWIMKIGQELLMKDMICLHLRMLGKTKSPRLFLVLNNLNNAIISDVYKHEFEKNVKTEEIETKPENEQDEKESEYSKEQKLLYFCNPYFLKIGLVDTKNKIFITCEKIEYLSTILFGCVEINITNMDYDTILKSLVPRKKTTFEPCYFLTGLLCLLRQFHPEQKLFFFNHLANTIKTTLKFLLSNREKQPNPEVVSDFLTKLRFFEECIKVSKEPYEKYKEIIDLGLLSSLDLDTLKKKSKHD